jgi:extracellular elastinolytic metalloproteinase
MNSGCLGFGEAGGMGEGWGDAIATLIRQIEEHMNFRYVVRTGRETVADQ